MGSYDKSWGSLETEFAFDQQEAHYPSLVRMYQDFDFKIEQAGQSRFWLCTQEYLGVKAVDISPVMDSLEALEQYVSKNMVDILYSYLFDIPSHEAQELSQRGQV